GSGHSTRDGLEIRMLRSPCGPGMMMVTASAAMPATLPQRRVLRLRGQLRLPESLSLVAASSAGSSFRGLLVTVLRRCAGHERVEEVPRGVRDLSDGAFERVRVGLRGLRRTAHFADVLERRGIDLVVGGGGLEVVQYVD